MRVAVPVRLLIVAAAAVAWSPLASRPVIDAEVFAPTSASADLVLGVAFLGLADDALSGPSRGWRGHGAAVLGRRLQHGGAEGGRRTRPRDVRARGPVTGDDGEYLLAVAVLVLATNLFNLLDLRPGRRGEGVRRCSGSALTVGAWDLGARRGASACSPGPLLVVGLSDLRERAMLGDTGSNLVGALAGLWLVLGSRHARPGRRAGARRRA